MRLALVTIIMMIGACSGTAKQGIVMTPVPARETNAALAGALCAPGHCTCRDVAAAGDGGVGVPDDAAHKRYEIRIGPSSQELWLSMGGQVFYKSAERAEECFYVDLSTGEHPIELRASNKDGVSAQWIVSELGTKTKSWYDTFKFNCGSPGVCSFSEIDAMKDEQQIAKRNLRDPCGSTKVTSVTWDTGKAPDQEHPSELIVKATLNVYKFTPYRPHGDEACGKGGGRAPNDDGEPTDTVAPPP